MQPNTRAVYLESPGSLTFEVQDVPAIAEAAHARGAVVLMDNTWASPLYFRALEKGVDLAIQSGSKYIGGHADLMLGVVAANAKCWPQLNRDGVLDGAVRRPRRHVSRAARPAHHGGAACASQSGRVESRALVRAAPGGRPRPASRPGKLSRACDLETGLFTGACGLFSIVLKPVPEAAVHAFIDALDAVRHRRLLGRL